MSFPRFLPLFMLFPLSVLGCGSTTTSIDGPYEYTRTYGSGWGSVDLIEVDSAAKTLSRSFVEGGSPTTVSLTEAEITGITNALEHADFMNLDPRYDTPTGVNDAGGAVATLVTNGARYVVQYGAAPAEVFDLDHVLLQIADAKVPPPAAP